MANFSGALRTGVIALGLLGSGVAAAQGLLCLPGMNPRRIDGDLDIVTRCELEGTDVRGDVHLFTGGSLVARDVRIRGSLTGNSADFVNMNGGRIDRGLELEQMVGDLIRFEGANLGGGVSLVGNRSRLEFVDNEIQRDMDVLANVGGVLLTGNTIENLRCEDNAPAPLGADNQIANLRDEDDGGNQCANLALEPPETPPPPEPPPPESPPPQTPPPQTPPPSSPPPATPPPSTPPADPAPSANFVPDPNGGGGGSMGLLWLALLPFAAWRRAARK
jgi:hypothetical protein